MKKLNLSGFTLIEMMIALTILSFIALAVYNNTAQSFILRDNVEKDGDFYNAVRVTLDVLGRDLSHVYSPQSAALPGDVGKAPAKPTQANNPGYSNGYAQPESFGNLTKFWSEPINVSGVRASRLQGEAGKISFVINSHMRLFRDTAESDFAKISYALQEDKDPLPGQAPNGKILVKHEDPDAFNEKENVETDVTYDLLSNIKSMEFKFLDGEKDVWYNSWDTSGSDHKGIFPALIQITLEIFTPNSSNAAPGTERGTLKVIQRFRPELAI